MARISLRAYNKEIEAMIDRNDIDEAIKNCRTILERFPKHVDTYRLMGKALLEGQRFSDAADVFHRVLSSVPDDFIAHLGMSIIREEEGNLDGAIWHMERSFEVQPSNAAIQVELRRLYGLRDGLSPQKIQLTRGALARMSAKSNLYSQAIAELRTALSDDPQRPDLQVVLATMYAQTGARMEAIETCNTLLSKLPYCLEANRILAEILPETERAELAQEYKNRLIELDPYYAHISAAAGTLDQIPDNAVTIEQNELAPDDGDSEPVDGQNWAATLGISLDEPPTSDEESPEWLSAEEEISELIQKESKDHGKEEDTMNEIEPESTSPKSSEQEDLPDWMSEADWDEVSEGSESSDDETPEWLRAVMDSPDEEELSDTTTDLKNGVPEDAGEELIEVDEPDSSGAAVGAAVAGAAVGAIIDNEEDTADQETGQDQLDSSVEEGLTFEDEPEFETLEPEEPSEEEMLDDVAEEGGEIIGEAVVGAIALDEATDEETDSSPEEWETSSEELEDVPDWLQDLGEGIPEEEIQPEEVSLHGTEPTTEPEEQITSEPIQQPDVGVVDPEEIPDTLPEWLSAVSPEKVPAVDISEDVEPGEETEIVLARIPAWLKQMEQEHLAQMAKETEKSKHLDYLEFDSEITDLSGEDVPSWLMDAMEPELSAEAEVTETIESIEDVSEQPPAEELQDVEPHLIESTTGEPSTEEEFTSEGAAQFVEETTVDGDTQPVFITTPEDVEIEDKILDAEDVSELAEEVMPQPIEEIEDQPVSLEEAVEAPPLSEGATLSDEDEDAALAWLEGLAEKHGVSQDELLTSPEKRSEVPPEWIQELVPEEDALEEDAEGVHEGFAAAAIAGLAIGKQLDEEQEESLTLEPSEQVSEEGPSEWIPDFEETDEDVEKSQVEAIDSEKIESPTAPEVETISEEQAEKDVHIEAEDIAAGVVAGAILEEGPGEEETLVPEVDLPEESEPEVTVVEPSEWLTEIEEPEGKGLDSEVREQQPELIEGEITDEVEKELISPIEETPVEESKTQEWYQDLEPEEVSGETPSGEWTPAMLVEEEAIEDTQEIRVDKKLDLNAASLSQLERIPSIGFIHAQRIINYRETSGPFKDFEELGKVPGITSEILDDLKEYLTVEVVEEAVPPLSTDPELRKAWESVSAGELEEAINQYDQLINNEENLDEVIRDLQEAIVKFPTDASLYQTLGDAYLHANLLQEALDAYNRAEDLIS